MSDQAKEIAQAERIRRLQERRAAAGRTPRPAVASAARADATARPARPRPSDPKHRRRHPAAATRWLLGGLSIASFFGIAGTVAVANVSGVAAPAPVTVAAPATNAVASGAPAAATPAAPRATSPQTSSSRAPHTTTHGS